jgi:hypothetical protein
MANSKQVRSDTLNEWINTGRLINLLNQLRTKCQLVLKAIEDVGWNAG